MLQKDAEKMVERYIRAEEVLRSFKYMSNEEAQTKIKQINNAFDDFMACDPSSQEIEDVMSHVILTSHMFAWLIAYGEKQAELKADQVRQELTR